MSPGCQNEDTKGEDYEGNVAKTVSGLECQKWSEQKPHKHKFSDLGEHNSCRNPDDHKGVWCYTTDKNKRWELCDVPKCDIGPFGVLRQNIVNILIRMFLAVQNSSIGDLVTHSLTHSPL